MAANEYQPLADKAQAEVSGFVRLWRRQKWLAILLLCGVVGWGFFPLVAWFHRGEKITDLEKEIGSKSAKIQELETQLTPFKTLALERFSKADTEALQKLAATIISLQTDYSNNIATIESLRSQLEQVRKSGQKRSQILTENSQLVVGTLKGIKARKIACSIIPGDAETIDFAKSLLNAFAIAGWETVNTVNKMQLDEFNEQFVGVTVFVSSKNEKYPDCLQIQQLLSSIGIQCRVQRVDVYFDKPYDPENQILLNIGRIDR